MGNRALVADSMETWVSFSSELALLIGVDTFALIGWWWADPIDVLIMFVGDSLAGLGEYWPKPASAMTSDHPCATTSIERELLRNYSGG